MGIENFPNEIKCLSYLPDSELYYHKKASKLLSIMLEKLLCKDMDIERISIFTEMIPTYHLANFFFVLINAMLSMCSIKVNNNYVSLWYLVKNILKICPSCATIKDNNGYYLLHIFLMNDTSLCKYEISIFNDLLKANPTCVINLVPFLGTSSQITCTILHYLLMNGSSYCHYKAVEQILCAFPAVAT